MEKILGDYIAKLIVDTFWYIWQYLKSNDPGGGHELRNTLKNVFSISGSDGTQFDGVPLFST